MACRSGGGDCPKSGDDVALLNFYECTLDLGTTREVLRLNRRDCGTKLNEFSKDVPGGSSIFAIACGLAFIDCDGVAGSGRG